MGNKQIYTIYSIQLYRNRKGFFSINVQAVCDSDLKFTNIIARWPGSVHDSRIFNNSRLCAQLENRDYKGKLIIKLITYIKYIVFKLNVSSDVRKK